MVIGETLRRALDKLVMRAAGGQVNRACGNLQLCAGLDAGIEGATNDVGQMRLERVRKRRQEEEETKHPEEEEEGGGIAEALNNLTIETAGTEAGAVEGLEGALEMEVEEDGGSKGEKGGDRGSSPRIRIISFFYVMKIHYL